MTYQDVIESPWLEVEPGLELLDEDQVLIEDISDDLVGGSVSHNNSNLIHGSATFQIERELAWHNQRLRPYMTVRNQTGEEYTYYLGVYLPNTPSRVSGDVPQIFDVEAYDALTHINTPYGASLSVDEGTSYITQIETLLTAAGVPAYSIDQTEAATTTPSTFVWAIDDRNTYLKIINDLLLGIGYEELYSDRNGTLRAGPFAFPQDKSSTWTYNTESEDTIVVEGARSESDLHEIPNKWVFIRDDPEQVLPSEGDGLYTVTNQSSGITSVDSRGRTITKIQNIKTAYSQTELEIIGDMIADKDQQPRTTVSMSSGPNPIHFHYEVVTLNAPEIGAASAKYLQESWQLDLSGADMTHELREVI